MLDCVIDVDKWANQVFGSCQLGDARRTKRLVDVAKRHALTPSAAPLEACEGDIGATEGAYRLIRNQKISPNAIADGGFSATAQIAAKQEGIILALEDTTSLSFPHAASDLGCVGGKNNIMRGFNVHSVMLLAESGMPIGLIEQERWKRNPATFGIGKFARFRDYKDKESFKWQRASERVAEKLGSTMSRTISICDREADIYNYLAYKLDHNQRFVVRAVRNRRLKERSKNKLFEKLRSNTVLGIREINLPQQGGYPARKVRLEIRSELVTLAFPEGMRRGRTKRINIWAVHAREQVPKNEEDVLEWFLLTSENAESFAQADQIVNIYAKRWCIEDFHKAWKSGTKVEERRMQTADNLERMSVILAFVAVRLLQLRRLVNIKPTAKCTQVLKKDEWKCLWVSVEKKKLPDKTPSVKWAYYAIAKLGCWIDTKRTGRVGWKAMWKGLSRLNDKVEAIKIAQECLEM